jgi:2-dehydropantoate 2-reductase
LKGYRYFWLQEDRMKICILGSGALGSTIGGVLTESGSEVYLIDTWAEHVNTMNRQGLKLREDASDRTLQVRAATDCHGIGPADLILVLVKSYHTKEAIKNATPIIGDKSVVLSFQNGLGNEETLAEAVGKDHVIGGRTFAGGVMLGPGHVMAGCKGKQTYVGELDGRITERVNEIAKQFNQAGLETIVSSNIVGIMWDKLLINVATGALSGITRLPYGELYQVKEIMDCALEAVSEVIAVAKAMGVKLTITDPKKVWLKAAENLPPEFKASMLQDIEKGSRTEIDSINGLVVRLGEEHGVPTPVNRVLVAGIKGIEHHLKM